MPTLPDLWRKSQEYINRPDKRRAERYLRSVHKQFPEDPVTLTNLAALAYNRGGDDDAIEWIQKAMDASFALNNGHGHVFPHTRYCKGQIDLKNGDYASGWFGFEYRFALGFSAIQCPFETLWDGSYMGDNATLALWNEQGLGDQIMMARFVKQAKERSGAKVVLIVHESLVRLFEGIGADVVTSEWDQGYDRHAPLLSLPRILGVTLDTLDGSRYLHLGTQGDGPRHYEPRVGLCWRGQADTPELADRSIPEELLLPIKETGGWRSLQYGEDYFNPKDFLETAEAIASCDLVVTIDTSVAHLAGALGVPTWLMLRYHGEWRWGRGIDYSPWYSSFRIYRQPAARDWKSVIEQVTADLKERYAARS